MIVVMDIENDYKLVELMVKDSMSAEGIYSPGPYWKAKSKSALRQIKSLGISDFRGASNTIGLSFTDSLFFDVTLGHMTTKSKIVDRVMSLPGLSHKQKNQVTLARGLWDEQMRWKGALLAGSRRVGELLGKYSIKNTISAGCVDSVQVDGQTIATHYLQVLDTHDHLASQLDYTSVSSMLEIGGGFGSYTHLLVSNYPNLKKILYLDIAPNLYIGTQYLKTHFPGSVQDYRDLRRKDSIQFSDDDNLEILCITPFQLPDFVGSLDLIHNAHSFVEMPREIITNYANISLQSLSDDGAITLVSYDGFDENTIPPQELPNYFGVKFEQTIVPTLTPGRVNYHFIHPPLA